MTDTKTAPEQEVLPPETAIPEGTQDAKVEEPQGSTREVFNVSTNLNVAVETKDGTFVTIENVVYALKVAKMMTDDFLKRQIMVR